MTKSATWEENFGNIVEDERRIPHKNASILKEKEGEGERKGRQLREQLHLKTTHDKARTGCSAASHPRRDQKYARVCVCNDYRERKKERERTRKRESEVGSLGWSQNTSNHHFILEDRAKKQVSSLYSRFLIEQIVRRMNNILERFCSIVNVDQTI